MGKNKLKRFSENDSFENLIQYIPTYYGPDHELKGHWHEKIFNNNNPIVLELGCGRAEYTIGLASMYPNKNFVGIDIKGARIWRGAKTATEQNLNNAAFIRTRIQMVDKFFGAGEIDEIWITFPDPQPRPAKENKRLSSLFFLKKYEGFLKHNGIVHLKTDNFELYLYTLSIIEQSPFEILFSSSDVHQELDQNELKIQTTYEKKFRSEGKKINYLKMILK
ncbi:MAG TPA: tRNA (guanosine(46)-N7)-methyltransferase TrmB [Bacteroidia bacterium]|nr:tRNA (guanosine(46)-N7)-methyltransferase TrmB [Bacteroidia bacterium]HNT79254.1 tRNA (guanosine(46)-N7)-methyltransferase TrmB [Bacteroidia bacterium]